MNCMSETRVADTAFELIARWGTAAEADWSTVPVPAGFASDSGTPPPALGTYGTGYDGWGVQTQQKYLATMATIAVLGQKRGYAGSALALERALAALRFNLGSHKSGPLRCTDGTRWGHTWISALGIERMMFAVQMLLPYMDDADHATLRTMLTSEADWLLTEYRRGPHTGIQASLWNHSGCNDPESNIWNGALLWRTSAMYPDHPRAADWQERAHMFLINGISTGADAVNEAILAGKPVRERHIGANFFPNYALDHHAYMNVGYMVICLSNAAMLHMDMQAAGLPLPESLYLHQKDLWQVVRHMIFDDGRLARIGGDTRVRYAYCQEYLLPAQLFAAAALEDPQALAKIPLQLDFIRAEANATASGYFYDKRLAALRKQSPLYYTRLESDRSCTLAMLATYYEHARQQSGSAAGKTENRSATDKTKNGSATAQTPAAQAAPQTAKASPIQISSSGISWAEPLHGAALHRCPTRFASFAWRSANIAQGLCLPPARGDMAEWKYNLCGVVDFCHHPHPLHGVKEPNRRFNACSLTSFEGGFVTCGSFYEGVNLRLAESWSGTDSALHQVAFAALPDAHTVVCLQFCQMGERRGYVSEVRGLHLNIPTDVLSPASYTIASAEGTCTLQNPPPETALNALQSNWACVQDAIGVVGLYGAQSLVLDRSTHRRDSSLQSMLSDCLLWPYLEGHRAVEAGTTILDSGWATLSSVNAAQTHAFAKNNSTAAIDLHSTAPATGVTERLRALSVQAMDGKRYVLVANFGGQTASVQADRLIASGRLHDLSSAEVFTASDCIPLPLGQVRLLRAD